MKWTVKIWNEIPKSVHPNDTSKIRAEDQALLLIAVSVPENRMSVESFVHFEEEDLEERISKGKLIDSMTTKINPATLERAANSGAEEQAEEPERTYT
ncbi:hypothetical protein K3495_g7327 [Podosphaera aphanis]|nr:hypothetical protein K3495_g7327 [Podosphaera aphanis]